MEKLVAIPIGVLIFALTLIIPTLGARTWTSADGTRTFQGELRRFNPETGMVEVVVNGRLIQFDQAMLSAQDRAFLAAGLEEKAELEAVDWGEILSSKTPDHLPAIGGIVIIDGKMTRPSVHGLRKFGGTEPVRAEDRWHVGSCTKAMTATLVASFVEEGEVSWDTTIGEVFGEDAAIGEAYRPVTLRMLVTNRSGIPGRAPGEIWSNAWKANDAPDLVAARRQFVEAMLNVEPSFEPGTSYEYSNNGYVTAGAMLEQISGQSWEDLMRERIFEPLQMKSAGFGAPGTPGTEDQPWGHRDLQSPVEPGPSADNPKVIGPAGTVHASLEDIARFVRMHLLRETGPVLKQAETFDFLHQIGEGNRNYAAGWVVLNRDWAGGQALTHSGSNTMNNCLIWFAPEKQFACIIVTNIATDEAKELSDQAVAESVEKFLGTD